jgi:plasmid stability protein
MLEESVYHELRIRAAGEGRTLQQVTNDLLRFALEHEGRATYELDLQGWTAEEQPGVDICDRDKLFDLMNGR